MGLTHDVSERISSTRFADIPPEVVDYAKTLTLSALGAMVAGATRNSGRILTEYAARAGGAPEAAVLGTRLRASAETAALATASFAHATEYEDDSFPEAVSTYTIFPVVFALGERLRRSGRDLLEAFVVGYETQAKIAMACPDIRRRGMLTLSVAGTLGSTAAAARLLGLDAHRTAMALSLAASQASGIAHQTGTTAHTFEMGIAARNGIASALLAAAGATGQPDILEAPRGLLHVVNGGNIPKPEDVLGPWGDPYRLMQVGIKMYPCCYHLQRIIEALRLARQQQGLSAADVEDVQVDVNLFIPQVIQYPEPRDEDEAQFSMQHAVAAALLDDRVAPESFGERALADPTYQALRRKVRMVVREEWGWATVGWTPIITIRTRSGRTLRLEHEHARGQPPRLLGFDDVIEKYDTCMLGRIPDERRLRSIEMMRHLDRLDDVSKLVAEVAV